MNYKQCKQIAITISLFFLVVILTSCSHTIRKETHHQLSKELMKASLESFYTENTATIKELDETSCKGLNNVYAEELNKVFRSEFNNVFTQQFNTAFTNEFNKIFDREFTNAFQRKINDEYQTIYPDTIPILESLRKDMAMDFKEFSETFTTNFNNIFLEKFNHSFVNDFNNILAEKFYDITNEVNVVYLLSSFCRRDTVPKPKPPPPPPPLNLLVWDNIQSTVPFKEDRLNFSSFRPDISFTKGKNNVEVMMRSTCWQPLYLVTQISPGQRCYIMKISPEF